MRKFTKKQKDLLKSSIVIVIIFILWMILTWGDSSSFVFPGPQKVWSTFLSMLYSGELLSSVLISLYRVLLGFAISFVLAFVFGVLAGAFPSTEPFYRPVFSFFNHVPPISLIPLLILWFGIGETSKIIVIVLTGFFPIFINVESGIKNCDKKLLELGKSLNMSNLSIFFQIKLPFAFSHILAGMQIGLGYCWRAIVAAEMIAASTGLGHMILDAKTMSRPDKVLVGIILIGILGLILDFCFNLLIKKLTKNKEFVSEK